MNVKLIALAIAFAVLTVGCSNSVSLSDQQFDLTTQHSEAQPSPTPEPAGPVSELRLPFLNSDSLNPYTMKTQLNRELVPLLYDSLTRPDKSWRPQNLLATEVVVEDRLCTVRFNRSAQFSDGTLLTGKDILYSLTTASASETNWRTMLKNVANCSINADGDVEIRLYQPDADFPALLTFPIVKEGTATEDFPTGVSKFYVSGTWKNGVLLAVNPLYWAGSGNLKEIRLTHVSDPDALSFALKAGDIDMSFSDMSVSEMTGMSASSASVSLNSLVYMGVNSTRGLLAEPAFRQAISTAINRDELVSKAFAGRARGTMYPFNPNFYRLEKIDLSTPRNLTQAGALLDGLGLTERDAEGYRMRGGQRVTLRLLVNSENAARNAATTLITEQLTLIGVQVQVVSQSYSQYLTSLSSLNYDLYLGETRLTDNMDFSVLMNGGALAYGAPYVEGLATLYRNYRSTGNGIEAVCEAFLTDPPFVPLVFRHGLVSVNRTFRVEMVATEQDIFYNIMEW